MLAVNIGLLTYKVFVPSSFFHVTSLIFIIFQARNKLSQPVAQEGEQAS